MKSMKKVYLFASIALVCTQLVACGNSNIKQNSNSSLEAENNSLKKSITNTTIVGSYKDDSDGAAIVLNDNGTGRYVYADPVNSDTDDQLTWKKNSNNTYTITLKDSNVTSSLTAKLSGSSMTLTGDSNWNTERFTKVKKGIDLDKFLTDHHQGSGSNNSLPNSKAKDNQNSVTLPPSDNIHDFVNRYGVSPALYKEQHGMSEKDALDSTPDNMKTSGELQTQHQLDQGQ